MKTSAVTSFLACAVIVLSSPQADACTRILYETGANSFIVGRTMDCLIDVWNKACQAVGVENVGLYGGTRHTTCQYLRQQGKTPEEVKRFTDHSTNKAFDRYLEIQIEEKIEGVMLARTTNGPPKTRSQSL